MSDLEALFLQDFFEGLRQRAVSYSVLRGADQLPQTVGQGDLDILVSPSCEGRFLDVLRETVRKYRGAFVGCASSPGFSKVHLLVEDGAGEWWGLCVDVFTCIPFRGKTLFDWSGLSKGLEEKKGISTLNPYYGSLLGLLKELLWNKKIDQRYLDLANSLPLGGWECVGSAFPPALLGGSPKEFLVSITKATDAEADEFALADELIGRANRLIRSRGWARELVDLTRYQWSKLKRMFNPSGLCVAFLGVDGAGKSTVIEGVVPILEKVTHGGVYVRHLRPSLLPSLATLMGRPTATNEVVTNPHGSTPSGVTGSLVRALYYAADYLFGYWLVVRMLAARRPDVVIFDRYHFDLILDPRRFRIGFSSRALRPLVRLLPQPDLVICLIADPQVIHQRKPELPLQEVCQQVERLEELANSFGNAVIVRTDISEDQSRNLTFTAIRDFLLKRHSSECA